MSEYQTKSLWNHFLIIWGKISGIVSVIGIIWGFLGGFFSNFQNIIIVSNFLTNKGCLTIDAGNLKADEKTKELKGLGSCDNQKKEQIIKNRLNDFFQIYSNKDVKNKDIFYLVCSKDYFRDENDEFTRFKDDRNKTPNLKSEDKDFCSMVQNQKPSITDILIDSINLKETKSENRNEREKNREYVSFYGRFWDYNPNFKTFSGKLILEKSGSSEKIGENYYIISDSPNSEILKNDKYAINHNKGFGFGVDCPSNKYSYKDGTKLVYTSNNSFECPEIDLISKNESSVTLSTSSLNFNSKIVNSTPCTVSNRYILTGKEDVSKPLQYASEKTCEYDIKENFIITTDENPTWKAKSETVNDKLLCTDGVWYAKAKSNDIKIPLQYFTENNVCTESLNISIKKLP